MTASKATAPRIPTSRASCAEDQGLARRLSSAASPSLNPVSRVAARHRLAVQRIDGDRALLGFLQILLEIVFNQEHRAAASRETGLERHPIGLHRIGREFEPSLQRDPGGRVDLQHQIALGAVGHRHAEHQLLRVLFDQGLDERARRRPVLCLCFGANQRPLSESPGELRRGRFGGRAGGWLRHRGAGRWLGGLRRCAAREKDNERCRDKGASGSVLHRASLAGKRESSTGRRACPICAFMRVRGLGHGGSCRR